MELKVGSGAPTNFGAAEKEVSKSLFAVNLTHARVYVKAKYRVVIMLNKTHRSEVVEAEFSFYKSAIQRLQ